MPIDIVQNPAGRILTTDLVSWQLGHEKEPLRLTLGYRQEAILCKMVSDLAYKGEISPAPSTYNMPNANIVRSFNQSVFKLSTSIPCALINIKDTYESKIDHTQSTFNRGSANYAIDLALRLVLHFDIKKITILTSYTAQKALLENIIASNRELKGLKVFTVKNYSSSENDIVIYDHARTTELGFTRSPDHWRVVLTRARCGLFLLMSRTALWRTLSYCKFLQNMVELLERNKLTCDWNLPKPKDRSNIFLLKSGLQLLARMDNNRVQ